MPSSTENFDTLIIANPQSQNGALGRKWAQLERVIRERFGAFSHRFTIGAGDATRITRRALADGTHEMVVAMGGDGTISEVVDGFFSDQGPVRPEAVLGVLPFGTGGDFRKTIGAPKKLAAGAASLRGRDTRTIDAGRLFYIDNDGEQRVRHFINVTSFGIGGLVDQLVNTTTKALGGRVSFGLATLRAMRRFSPQRARLRLDGGPVQEVLLHNIAVANGQYFGGGMWIAPRAELDDGKFDVVTIGRLTGWDILLRMGRIYKGTHLELPQVSHALAARVEAEPVDPDEHILLDVDGETPGRLPATFQLLPRALKLKWPLQ
jgi:YegS/Rv2252/BmrU family lipid kinase